MEVDDGTIAEIALIENMQRKDLTVGKKRWITGAVRKVWLHARRCCSQGRKEQNNRHRGDGDCENSRGCPRDMQRRRHQCEVFSATDCSPTDDETMLSLAKQIASKGLNRNDAREVRRQEMGPRVVPDTKPSPSNMLHLIRISIWKSNSAVRMCLTLT
jgi:hypothetical protein